MKARQMASDYQQLFGGLAKEFGGTDGHKYVNGVLNGLAPKLRAP